MTKTAKISSLVAFLFVAVGFAAPVASAVANAPKDVTMFDGSSGRVLGVSEAPVETIDVLDLQVEPKAKKVASRASAKQAEPRVCHRHELEQGGSPTAQFVTVCL